MSLRYKVGDRVALGDAYDLEAVCIPREYRHCVGIIIELDKGDEREPYKIKFEDDDCWWASDNCIDHEATAKLNNKPNDGSISSVVSIDMSSYITRKIDCEGGETMNANEILEKWRNRKADELISQRDAEIKKVTKEDEIQKLVKEHETEINKIIKEKYKVDTQVSQIFCTITTRKTGDKIETINKEFDKKVAELDKKEEEIKAVLEVAENQDKVFEILNKQGIIDKNYNIL